MSEKFGFIDAQYADAIAADESSAPSVVKMCVWLEVSCSGFYEWRGRAASATARRRNELALYVVKSLDESEESYGYRRVHADLIDWGVEAGPELVRSIMRELDLDRYITVVVDHDSGRLVWAAEGRNQETLRAFFDALGPERAKLLTHVSADGAGWIHDVVRERAPQVVICLDPFHVVAWATGALDALRRRLAGELRAAGKDGQAATIRHTRWALVKNPADLTPGQRGTLAQIAADNSQLYRGYLMKEQLREIFQAGTEDGKALLAGLISWARRSRIPEFARLAKTLKNFQELLQNTLDHHLSNARAEGHKYPAGRPHYPGPRLPQRRRFHRHGQPHIRRPMPAFAQTMTTKHRPPLGKSRDWASGADAERGQESGASGTRPGSRKGMVRA